MCVFNEVRLGQECVSVDLRSLTVCGLNKSIFECVCGAQFSLSTVRTAALQLYVSKYIRVIVYVFQWSGLRYVNMHINLCVGMFVCLFCIFGLSRSLSVHVCVHVFSEIDDRLTSVNGHHCLSHSVPSCFVSHLSLSFFPSFAQDSHLLIFYS